MKTTYRRLLVIVFALLAQALPFSTLAASPDNTLTRDKLMVVLRESIGANKQDSALVPTGKQTFRLPDGKQIEVEMAHFEYLGDMHIRFVFDGPQSMRNATPKDLANLGLSTGEALQQAIENIKRVYGNPESSPFVGSVMEVKGTSPDLDSSYFLDQVFWTGLGTKYPNGMIVAVPKRGALLYVSASDEAAVAQLRKLIAPLHASSGNLRVSSALYLFKDGNWSVFQAPAKP